MFNKISILLGVLVIMSCSSQTVANNGLYELKNQKIYFHNHGDYNNRNLLLVHGLMGSSNSFDEIVSELEKHYYLTVIDLPGHGDSNLQIEFSIEELSNVLESFIKDNFKGKLDMVGYSLGGTLTNNLLSRNNNQIDNVILIDPWFSNNTTIDAAAFKLLGFIEKREKNGWDNFKDAVKYVDNMNPSLNDIQNESIAKNRFDYDIKIWESPIQRGTLIRKEELTIDNNVLLIKPESSLIRDSQINKLKNNFSNLFIEEIKESTHMIIFEKPNEISDKIFNFLK
tara:strand:+ start:998 stop:1846 length:849 start_codon:yes stop_codon:yes gene_type:complete